MGVRSKSPVPRTVSVTEMVRNFADYINRVFSRGERFVLIRNDKPVAELGPTPAGRRLEELPELLASLPHLPEVEAESFAGDLEAARSELSSAAVRDPWES